MYLLFLMLIPILVGLGGLLFTKGRINWKEFLVMEGAVLLVLLAGYGLSTWRSISDVEIWNGRIAFKGSWRVSCSHSYKCGCTTDKDGNESCSTCYDHAWDIDWVLKTNNDELIVIDRHDRQGTVEPPRWQAAYVGEPTAIRHSYRNYLKASPDSILRRTSAKSGFEKWLPPYPAFQYDYYRVDRFFSEGFNAPDKRTWVWLLNELNADTGQSKQVNVVVGLIKHPDPRYAFALEEHWLGGKKNDAIVLIGVPDYPRIAWVGVVSWSKAEIFKVAVRDAILDIGTVERRDDIMTAIHNAVDLHYVRRPMDDFKYLAASAQPGPGATIFLFMLGAAMCGGLATYFYRNDPFDTRVGIYKATGADYWRGPCR